MGACVVSAYLKVPAQVHFPKDKLWFFLLWNFKNALKTAVSSFDHLNFHPPLASFLKIYKLINMSNKALRGCSFSNNSKVYLNDTG